MFKKRKLVIGMLILLATLVSGFTFAYWASNVSGDTDTATGTVTIGTGDAVTTTATVSDVTNSGPLVPVGHSGTNQVDLTFNLLWTSNNDATGDALTGVLAVNIDSVQIEGVDYSHLFTVTLVSGDGAITEDSSQAIVINVEFTNEPADATEYALVATKSLVITITFTVTPN